MATPKTALIKLELSGKSISFESPVNYSKDYPWPKKMQYRINLFDQDIYKSPYSAFENTFSIRQSFWDYGRNIIFGSVKGTLSMGLALYMDKDKNINLKNNDTLLNALKVDFEAVFDKKTRDESGVELPKKYRIKRISVNDWGNYEFLIDGGRHVVYALPVTEQHYLMVSFNFINNSEGKKNNWKEQAQKTVDSIMSSFKVH